MYKGQVGGTKIAKKISKMMGSKGSKSVGKGLKKSSKKFGIKV